MPKRINNCSCASDVLTLEGKIFANVLFLTDEDEPKLKSQEYVLDFSQEVLCTGINQDNFAYCKMVLNNIDYEIQGEMNSSKGVLIIKTQSTILGVVKQKVVLNGLIDVFCPTHNITCESANMITQTCNNLYLREKIDGSLSINDDVQLDKVLCISNAYVTFNTAKQENGFEIVGVLHANVIYKIDDEKGTIGAVVAELPFVKQVDDCNYNSLNIEISVSNIEARSKRVKDIDLQSELTILINYAHNESKAIVSNIVIGEVLEQNYKPIGVYVISQASELWDVAKLLRTNPNRITAQNPNLTFPITEPTKVLVYRQYGCE